MNGMKILCVEGQPERMVTLTRMLEGIGYKVMGASNGRQAVDLLTQEAIDGVLLEHDLPDATGIDLLSRLKKIHPEVPMLILAGVGSQTTSMLRFFDAFLKWRKV